MNKTKKQNKEISEELERLSKLDKEQLLKIITSLYSHINELLQKNNELIQSWGVPQRSLSISTLNDSYSISGPEGFKKLHSFLKKMMIRETERRKDQKTGINYFG